MTSWGKRWLVWILLVVGSFALLEGFAIYDQAKGDTLSEQVWLLLAFPAFSVPFFICFTGGCVWLWMHFFRNHKP